MPIVVLVLLFSGAGWAQVPDVSAPPLLNDAVPPPSEHEVFVNSVDRRLLSFRSDGFGMKLANRDKSLGLGRMFWDGELESMFSAVPAAMTLFQDARDKTAIASMLTLGGFAGVGGSVVMLAIFLSLPAASLPVLIAALAFDAVALVLTLIAVPFRMRAQSGLYEAVETHNRGLLRLPAPVVLRF